MAVESGGLSFILADRGELDIHSARWRIPEAKTPAGERDVELTAFTRDELRAHLARRPLTASSPLFPTWPGGRLNDSNTRNRLHNGEPARPATETRRTRPAIKGLMERVNEKRAAGGPDASARTRDAAHAAPYVGDARADRRPGCSLGDGTGRHLDAAQLGTGLGSC